MTSCPSSKTNLVDLLLRHAAYLAITVDWPIIQYCVFQKDLSSNQKGVVNPLRTWVTTAPVATYCLESWDYSIQGPKSGKLLAFQPIPLCTNFHTMKARQYGGSFQITSSRTPQFYSTTESTAHLSFFNKLHTCIECYLRHIPDPLHTFSSLCPPCISHFLLL